MTLNKNEVNVLDYTEAIVLGFTEIYQLLLKHREELLTVNSLLMNFSNDEVRIVLRPTGDGTVLFMREVQEFRILIHW